MSETTNLERLSGDDLATRTEQLFLENALKRHAQVAGALASARAGVCTNCAERCHPAAIYCDAECRDDHESRLRVDRARRR